MRSALILSLMLFTTLAAAEEQIPGKVLFKRKACSTCHAADGSGNTPVGKSLKARDLRSEEVQKQTDEELTSTIADGRGKMPAYKSSLSPEEIRELVAFIRSIKNQPQ